MPPDRDIHEMLSEIPDPVAMRSPAPARPWSAKSMLPSSLPSSPTRAQTSGRRVLALVAALLWVAGFLLAEGMRNDWTALPASFLWGQTALWVAGVAALLPWPRGRSGEAAPGSPRSCLSPASRLLRFSWSFRSPGSHRKAAWPDLAGRSMASRPALRSPCSPPLGPLFLSALALHRAFASAPTFHGAAVGVACGLLGALAAHLHCSAVGGVHVAVAHGGQILVGASWAVSSVTRSVGPDLP